MAKRSKEVKDIVHERDNEECAMCDIGYGLEVHHIHPLSAGGKDCELNAILLCTNCHKTTHLAYTRGVHWSKFYKYLEQRRKEIADGTSQQSQAGQRDTGKTTRARKRRSR